MSKEDTKHNRLTAFSASFIDSTAENAEEIAWLGLARWRGGSREMHAFVLYHQG